RGRGVVSGAGRAGGPAAPPLCGGWRGWPAEPGWPGVRPRRSRGSGIEVLHQLVEEARNEADGADRLGIGHARGAEDADDANGPAGLAVWGEDERDVAHLLGRVLGANEDLDD